MARVITVNKARKDQGACDKCGRQIKRGDPYKHMSIKTGPRSSRRLVRCHPCPTWQVWEYRDTRSAQAARICHDYSKTIYDCKSVEDIKSTMEEAAQEITELAEGAEESATNIVEGFGHETSQSEEIQGQADELNQWAQDVEQWDPDFDEDTDPHDDDWLQGQKDSASEVLDACPI